MPLPLKTLKIICAKLICFDAKNVGEIGPRVIMQSNKSELGIKFITSHPQAKLQQLSCPFRSHYVNTRRKLLCLILVASLALLSIVLISEQLISRHVHRSQGSLQVSVLSNIFLCH
jgi:hypothetical protein